jgi:hypothetical protein
MQALGGVVWCLVRNEEEVRHRVRGGTLARAEASTAPVSAEDGCECSNNPAPAGCRRFARSARSRVPARTAQEVDMRDEGGKRRRDTVRFLFVGEGPFGGGESACTPDSVRDLAVRWRPSISAGDCPPAPAAYPGSDGRVTLPLLGLAPDGVYRATRVTPSAGALLPHRFTLTCATGHNPEVRPSPSAVCSLLHFPAGHPDWALPSILPCGVRTFLGRITARKRVRTRPPGRLATAPIQPSAAICREMTPER